jgi:ATP-dependent helicase/nuclease subunit B
VLTGIADRIDRNRAGRLAVIDYKTGLPPSHAQWAGGYALQLGLLGALAAAGEFDGVAPGPVEALRYWQLGGGKDPGKVHDRLKHFKELTPAADHIATTRALFAKLCDEMLLGNAPFTAKLHPEYSAKYSDFDQLARVLEWRGRPDGAVPAGVVS